MFSFACKIWRVVIFLDKHTAANYYIPFHGLRVVLYNNGTELIYRVKIIHDAGFMGVG